MQTTPRVYVYYGSFYLKRDSPHDRNIEMNKELRAMQEEGSHVINYQHLGERPSNAVPGVMWVDYVILYTKDED